MVDEKVLDSGLLIRFDINKGRFKNVLYFHNVKITTILKHYPHLVLILLVACVSQSADEPPKKIQTGSEQMNQYLPLLDGKNVAVVVNHTSMVGSSHLVDSLRKRGIKIQKVFGPEHGFRGQASDGEAVENEISDDFDIISLYGNNYKPTAEDLEAVDIVVFDIQDVGTRFYTYTSTMHYVMEACAENDVPVIILDRPNPNGHYIDGPILDPDFQSFVGMHPIPVVHGLTVGELAKMINSEGWLANQIQCDLTVIPVSNYTHSDQWSLSIPPSPNLPTDIAIGW
jgi:uncharacterized protein YbbC (DUF1343 family)